MHNLTSARAGGSFHVPLPWGANVTDAGFHAVAYQRRALRRRPVGGRGRSARHHPGHHAPTPYETALIGQTAAPRTCDGDGVDVWSVPGEVAGLLLGLGGGGATSTACMVGADPGALQAVDIDVPPVGSDYVTRAVNDCPAGAGSLGRSSDDLPRQGRDCP